MRILIITMDDPSFTVGFIKEIIRSRRKDIVGVVIAKGDRMRIGSKRSKLAYLLSLLLIMGPIFYFRNIYNKFVYRIRRIMPVSWQEVELLPLKQYAGSLGIKTINVSNLKDESVLAWIKGQSPDIIIHQSQNIVGKEILDSAKVGVINRHNALLPKNRGRLTPFWVLFRKELNTGVSIHWVTDKIDAGDIVYQESFPVEMNETFESLVRKNYQVAPRAMLEALHRIETGELVMKQNDSTEASYNSVPTLKDAFTFRWNRLKIVSR